jgi:hypothetical protein
MALPDNFSEWEHLQSTLLRYHNKLVREEFSDVTDDDALDIPRGSLKIACLLKDDDTAEMTNIRLTLFFMHARKAADMQAPLFGIPISEFEDKVTYKPQVNLLFQQDPDATPQKKSPITAEISFRLMNETPQTITEAELTTIARRIKAEFGTSGGYLWRKGKTLVTYRNRSQGMELKIYAYNESEGLEVIRKVCDAAAKPYIDDSVTVHESKASFPANPGTQVILGRSRPNRIKRPISYVRFVRATCSIHGLPNPVVLVGHPFRNVPPLVSFT